MIQEYTGKSEEDAKVMHEELVTWFSGKSGAEASVLDEYIDSDYAFDGTMYRGMHFEPGSQEYEAFAHMGTGDILTMEGNASWSSFEETARGFAHMGSNDYESVEVICVKNRTASPVAHLSSHGEQEVLSHSKAQWTVLRNETTNYGSGPRKTRLWVIEKGEFQNE